MTAKNWSKVFNQVKHKKTKLAKVIKFNKPKDRKMGIAKVKCRNCGRRGAHVSKYGLHVCRQCFRDIARSIGFKKYGHEV